MHQLSAKKFVYTHLCCVVLSWREDVFCVRDIFSHFCDIYCSIVLGFDISKYSPEYHVLS